VCTCCAGCSLVVFIMPRRPEFASRRRPSPSSHTHTQDWKTSRASSRCCATQRQTFTLPSCRRAGGSFVSDTSLGCTNCVHRISIVIVVVVIAVAAISGRPNGQERGHNGLAAGSRLRSPISAAPLAIRASTMPCSLPQLNRSLLHRQRPPADSIRQLGRAWPLSRPASGPVHLRASGGVCVRVRYDARASVLRDSPPHSAWRHTAR
jgi:hypothetical protein